MSQENLDLLKKAYAAIERDDLEAFLALVDPEVEFNSLIAESEGQLYRGHDGARQWWQQVKGSLGGLHYEAEKIEGRGDCVVAKLLVTGQVGGVAIPQTMWHVTRFEKGRAIWWGVYRTRDQALEAVGGGSEVALRTRQSGRGSE